MIWLFILLAQALSILIHTVGSYVFVILLKEKIEEVKLFSGPDLLKYEVRDIVYRLGLIPFGGYVKIENDPDNPPSLFSKLLLILAGSIFLLTVAIILMPAGEVIDMFQSGFLQITWGAVSPLGKGQEYLGQAWSYLNSAPFPHMVAAIGAKSATFNLLPIVPSSGGMIIYDILQRSKKFSEESLESFTKYEIMIWLLMMASWVFAVVVFVRSALITQ